MTPNRRGHMASHIARRKFLATLGGAAAAWPHAARAQQLAKLPTIGFLGPSTSSAGSPYVAAFVQRLRELGWTESRNLAIEYRWAEARTKRYGESATEFVRLKVDVIVTWGTAGVGGGEQGAAGILVLVCPGGEAGGTRPHTPVGGARGSVSRRP